jgi:hypothetical protein
MKTQDAIRILMLSPCYFRLPPPARKRLVQEFIASYVQAPAKPTVRENKK